MLTKLFLFFALAGSVAGAQQPLADSTHIPVDRIVAVVGEQALLWSDVMTQINQARASGMVLPKDSIAQMRMARQTLNDLIDEEILVQQAKELKIEVPDAEIAPNVDRQIQTVRAQFKTEDEYRTELRNAGLGTPEEYRRTLFDQFRRRLLQQRAFTELQKRVHPRSVTEAEVDSAFEKNKSVLQKRPALLTFRQIVISPKASPEAKKAARAKVDSIAAEIRAGGDFALIAKRESMDPGSKELGGDLGWSRRGATVPEFERVMFALNPGQTSSVFETSFGFHILRVDRVQAGEVKARHILIAPKIDSADLGRARMEADTVAMEWRRGAAFDSLAAKHHDPAEERGILQPFPKDSLPSSYTGAIAGKKSGDITDPFTLIGPRGQMKYAVMQIVTITDVGEYDLKEVREQIRTQLAQERSARQLLDDLRRKTYVSIRL
jgi:peptidyl-prolyl cis-trans isomerase SurA